jgi:hypothetical protein
MHDIAWISGFVKEDAENGSPVCCVISFATDCGYMHRL